LHTSAEAICPAENKKQSLIPRSPIDAIRRVLAADVESFRRLVERYQRPLLTH
jgi:hypothetical protein